MFKIIVQYLSKVIHVKCLELDRDKGRQPANEDNFFLFTRIFYVSSSLIFSSMEKKSTYSSLVSVTRHPDLKSTLSESAEFQKD